MTQTSKFAGQDQVLELLLEKKLLQIIVAAFSEIVSGYTQLSVSADGVVVADQLVTSSLAVGAAIRLSSEQMSFELFLGFPQDLFCLLYQKVFDVETVEISDQNHDFAGEILNIAFGSIDPKFREKGYRLNASLPLVFSGSQLNQVLSQFSGRVIQLTYLIDGRKFMVQLYSVGSLDLTWNYDGKVRSAG